MLKLLTRYAGLVKVPVICANCQKEALEQGRPVVVYDHVYWPPATDKTMDRKPTHITCPKHARIMMAKAKAFRKKLKARREASNG